MNYIWPIMIIISIAAAFFTGTLDETVASGLGAAKESVNTVLSFAGMMCFWTGIMKIAEDSGISKKLERLMRPLTKLLFPKLKSGDKALQKITENMVANLLGMGNAATPAGLRAAALMQQAHPGVAGNELCRLVVTNTASVQLIPTTVAAIRASLGAADAFDILPCVWITSLCSVSAGLLSARILERFFAE